MLKKFTRYPQQSRNSSVTDYKTLDAKALDLQLWWWRYSSGNQIRVVLGLCVVNGLLGLGLELHSGSTFLLSRLRCMLMISCIPTNGSHNSITLTCLTFSWWISLFLPVGEASPPNKCLTLFRKSILLWALSGWLMHWNDNVDNTVVHYRSLGFS